MEIIDRERAGKADLFFCLIDGGECDQAETGVGRRSRFAVQPSADWGGELTKIAITELRSLSAEEIGQWDVKRWGFFEIDDQ